MPEDPQRDQPSELMQTYAGYAASRRRQRSWSAENPGNAAIRAELVDAVLKLAETELRGARRILDVGCGGGWWLAQLAAEPAIRASLDGIDALPERVSAAQSRVPSAMIERADARRLPYADAIFGVVSIFTVLSSLPGPEDVDSVLLEARRVLAPGGIVLIWEPRLPNPLNRQTTLIARDQLARAFLGWPMASRTTTLVPALARHLGRSTGSALPVARAAGAASVPSPDANRA